MSKARLDLSMLAGREEAVLGAAQADDGSGFCLGCGAQASGVEPDARKYECEGCGARAVYGAEELVIMLGGV